MGWRAWDGAYGTVNQVCVQIGGVAPSGTQAAAKHPLTCRPASHPHVLPSPCLACLLLTAGRRLGLWTCGPPLRRCTGGRQAQKGLGQLVDDCMYSWRASLSTQVRTPTFMLRLTSLHSPLCTLDSSTLHSQLLRSTAGPGGGRRGRVELCVHFDHHGLQQVPGRGLAAAHQVG